MPIFINNKPLDTFNFSGGECHVNVTIDKHCEQITVLALLLNSNDIMNLLLCVDAIRRASAIVKINLTIPYFPYGRQDRVCNPGEALSVKVMADLVNSLNCHSVTIYDPHSDVTPALLNKCKVISLEEIVANSLVGKLISEMKLTLLSPDAGAEKKIMATAKRVSITDCMVGIISASKVRDTRTGEITATRIHGEVEDKNFIILDDICDGGRTFIEIAKLLKEKKANSVYLYVTHGIFSKGLEILKSHFKHIYCYHTMLSHDEIDPSFLTILQSARA